MTYLDMAPPTWKGLLGSLVMSLAVRLLPELEDLIVLGVQGLLARMKATNTPVSTAGVAYEIVAGLEKDYPNLPGTEKLILASDAVRSYIRSKGGAPDDAIVHGIVTVAVNAWRAKGAEIARRA